MRHHIRPYGMASYRALLFLVVTPVLPLCAQGDAPAPPARVLLRHSYNAGPIWRFLFGSNWREAWRQPISAPVLDLADHGGLVPFKAGGNQSSTLHFHAGDGQRYVFRSIEKGSGVGKSEDLKNTPAEEVIEDQASSGIPPAAAITDILSSAANVLHPVPRLIALPDDARLGEFRKKFAGLVGYLEIKPDNASGDVESFAGADKIKSTDDMLDDLDASLHNHFDARGYLTARLLDALIGDLDRGADQWDWARYDSAATRLYKPIARDHDWAFMRANGKLTRLARHVYKKIGSFDLKSEGLPRITFMTHEFDRSHLVALAPAAWDAVVRELQASLTALVIDSALAVEPRLPVATASRISAALKSRVAQLPEVAAAYFRMVNEQADVFAADERELAEVDRAADGSVRVRLTRYDSAGQRGAEGPAFDRVFTPDITREIRVYLQEGDDRAIVRGDVERSITVRIIGGGGNDHLLDSSRIAHGGTTTRFYDAAGRNEIVRGPDTHVDERRFTTPPPGKLEKDDSAKKVERTVKEERRGRFEDQRNSAGDVIAQKMQGGEPRAWGNAGAINPVFRIQRGGGMAVGMGITRTTFGFRANPFASKLSASVLYGTATRRFGTELMGEWHASNSTRSISIAARAVGFVAGRFYGFGNDAPHTDDLAALIYRDDVVLQPMVRWQLSPDTRFGIGAIAHYVSPRPAAGSPALNARAVGSSEFGAVGVVIEADRNSVDQQTVPHSGYRATFKAAAYPAAWDAKEGFSTMYGSLAGYVPVGRTTIALRAVGQRAWGAFPLHEAAYLGGGRTLRGYQWNRFAGDAAVFGNAELRVPLFRFTPFTRGDLGVILLADAGKVWYKGASPAGWHTAAGGGLSFTTLGRAVSVVYVHGEVSKMYIYFGVAY